MEKFRNVLLLMIIFIGFWKPGFAKTSFAILPFELKGGAREADGVSALSRFSSDLLKARRYKLIDRQKINDILKEHKLQQSGLTEQAKLVKAGKILGVDKLVSSTLSRSGRNICMKINVINIETGEIELSVQKCYKSAVGAASLCARKIVLKYPMIGKIRGFASNMVVVDLGSNDGIANDDELFVARRNYLRDGKGTVLFDDYSRIGKLLVVKTSATRSLCKIIKLSKKSNQPKIKDDVSNEPIPHTKPKVFNKPFFKNISKGDIILDDDMDDKEYLAPIYNVGPAYIDGKLSLNNKAAGRTYVYCHYPVPYDKLADFILEAEFEYQKIKAKYNRFSISIRDNRDYHYMYAYIFYMTDEGNFSVSLFKSGEIVSITELETSPYIKRGESANEIKIIAKGAKFDFYINGHFIVAFEDEARRKGGIGLFAGKLSHVMVKNIKIWKIEK